MENRHILTKNLDGTTVFVNPDTLKVQVNPQGVNNKISVDTVNGVLEVRSPDGLSVVTSIPLKPINGIDEFIGWVFPAPTVDEVLAKYPATVDIKDLTTGLVIGKAWAASIDNLADVEVKDATTGETKYFALSSALAQGEKLLKVTDGLNSHFVVKV